MKNNIILIGMPGVGKSTIGVILAKILGYQFIDSDLVIQQQENRLLHQIIETEGVDGFLTIEDRINASIETTKSIISTGGSAVYGENAMKHFKEIGQIIYLSLNYEDLTKRLGDIKNRGVVIREGQTLHDIYLERTALYEKYADIIIDETKKSIEETLESIVNVLII